MVGEVPPGDDAADPEASSDSVERRFFNIRTLISFLIGFALLFFILTRTNIALGDVWATLSTANPWLVVAGFLSYYAGFPIRGLRWRRMLKDSGAADDAGVHMPSSWRLGSIIFMSWFANSVMPFKLGDLFRAYLLRTDAGIRASKGMGTILAERLLDLSCLLSMLAIAGFLSFRERLPGEVMLALEIGFGLVAVGVVGLLLMHHLDDVIVRLLPRRTRAFYARFQQGIIRSFRSPGFIVPLTILAWFTEIGRLLFVTWSLGVHPASGTGWELSMIAFIALASAAMTAVPATPGGLGLVEGLIVTAFLWSTQVGMTNVTPALATSVAILDRGISYLSVIVLGFILYLATRRR